MRVAAAMLLGWTSALLCSSPVPAQTQDANAPSDTGHVAPAPPETPMYDMSKREMTQMMEMNDAAALGKLLVDQLEWRDGDGTNGPAWDAQAWYGTDYNKLWFKTEGLRVDGVTEDARAELLWDRIFSRWWSVQAGARYDSATALLGVGWRLASKALRLTSSRSRRPPTSAMPGAPRPGSARSTICF